MANVVVKDNHLTYGGVAYFRGHAEDVKLGSIGEKRSPITKENYLEAKDRIWADKIGKATATKVKIDFTQSNKSAFNTAVSAIIEGVPVKLSGDAQFSKLNSGELDLIKLTVSANQMKKAANSSPNRLDDLDHYGHNARICHQIFVVVSAKIASQFDGDVEVNLSGGSDKIGATVGGSSATSRGTEVVFEKGTTFAYLLAKIDWEGHGKNKQIKDLDDDQWSFS